MSIEHAYIHIPFCKSKCYYCSFVSFDRLNLIDDYLTALKFQIDNEYNDDILKTLYLGGGTPSILSVNQIEAVLSNFKYGANVEITMEVNPNDLSLDYLKQLKKIGINRLSIGVQTFDDTILKTIGRRHDSKEAILAIEQAQEAEFNNISVDFIYGLPDQSLNAFKEELVKAIDMKINHISLYGLKIEENSVFYKHLPSNIADLDLQADMYLKAVELLKEHGFKHYEISNFSLDNFESKHNLSYWGAKNYYGFGCSASGYLKNKRYTNLNSLEDYIKYPLEKSSSEIVSEKNALEEAIFLGFRKMDGINISDVNSKFNIDFDKKYSKIFQKYKDYFLKTPNGYSLNLAGILISNEILSEFID